MKYILMLIGVCFLLACFVNTNKSYELPKTWNKDFSISLYEGGGMRYASTRAFFSTDSCNYIQMENGINKIKRFKLTVKEQEEILAKLNSFNVSAMETITTNDIVHDKETTSLCIHLNATEEHCLETGASIQIKAKYTKNFSEAYAYLEALAIQKSK